MARLIYGNIIEWYQSSQLHKLGSMGQNLFVLVVIRLMKCFKEIPHFELPNSILIDPGAGACLIWIRMVEFISEICENFKIDKAISEESHSID